MKKIICFILFISFSYTQNLEVFLKNDFSINKKNNKIEYNNTDILYRKLQEKKELKKKIKTLNIIRGILEK